MDRRGFLGAILAAGVAPAIGHAGVLMPGKKIITPLTLQQLQDIRNRVFREMLDNRAMAHNPLFWFDETKLNAAWMGRIRVDGTTIWVDGPLRSRT